MTLFFWYLISFPFSSSSFFLLSFLFLSPSSHLLSQGSLPYLAVAAIVAAIGISIAFYITQRH